MVHGANKSRSRVRFHVRTPSGSVLRFRETKPGKPESPSGKPLAGTARGTKNQVKKLTKTERRPSRPYGGVLDSMEMREVMEERVQALFSPETQGKLYQPGCVCMKIAGRDAGKLCVITEVVDNHFVKVDGFTRPRKVNVKHLEPVGKTVEVKKGASSKEIQQLL